MPNFPTQPFNWPQETPITQIKQTQAAGITPVSAVNRNQSPSVQGVPKPVTNVAVSKSILNTTQVQLTVTFTHNTSDPYFSTAQVYVKYGNSDPVLVSGGSKSPISFVIEKVSTPATVIVVSQGNWGSTAINNSPSATINLLGQSPVTQQQSGSTTTVVSGPGTGNFSANQVCASPASGGGGPLTVRGLVDNDLPGGVTGTGAVVLAHAPTFTANPTFASFTGSGAVVLATSPSIGSPTMSSATLSGTIAVSGTMSFSAANPNFFSSTGSGAVVLATSPTLVTPQLGTPASGNLANCTFPTLNQSTSGNAATASTASALTSATTVVNVSSATAPTSGQVLTATSGTAATWQTPSVSTGAWSGLTDPSGDLSLSTGGFQTTWTNTGQAGIPVHNTSQFNFTNTSTGSAAHSNATPGINFAANGYSSGSVPMGVQIEFLGEPGGSGLLNFNNTSIYPTTVGFNGLDVSANSISLGGIVDMYNDIATAAGGVAAIYAAPALLLQNGNISSTLLYATAASGGNGIYRATFYLVVTRAATSSSTLPDSEITYTDQYSGGTITVPCTTGATGNATTTFTYNSVIINPATNSNIFFAIGQNTPYASSGATAMQYAFTARLEYLG